MQKYSDIELLDAVNRRSEGIYKALHSRYFRILYVASVKITRHMPESEDIVNEVFIYFFTKCKREFYSLSAVFSYLHQAVRTRSLNYVSNPHLKGHKYFEGVYFEELDGYDLTMDSLELAYRETLWAIKYQKAIEAIETLPEGCKAVLKMIYFEQLTTREIAVKLDLNSQTVLNQKSIGLKRVAKILKEEDFLIEAVLIIVFLSHL